ncbi:MAG: DNA replication/repair protein RecF [Pseudomonadota bacterium]
MSAPHRLTVEHLRLAQYRSYALADVATGGASVALHGPNGSGKTNLLEAVSMLTPGRGLRRAGADELVRAPGGLGWKITAEVSGNEGVADVVTAVDSAEGTRRSVRIDDKQATQAALGRLVRAVWLTPAMDRLWAEAAGDRRRFLDRVTLGFFPAHGETSIAYERAMRERNRLLKEGIFDDAWLAALEAQMARAGSTIARARAVALALLIAAQETASAGSEKLFPKADLAILGDMESRFGQVIRESSDADDDLDALEGEEAAGLAQQLASGRPRDAAAGRTLTGPHRSDLEAVYAAKGMPARTCSTGEQKALLISLSLANARALADQNGETPLVLLDEVAAHLDDGRRRALYAEIEALGAQAWMTGTGPELFEGLADACHIAVTERDGTTELDVL